MGVYIGFDLIPEGISPLAWQDAYRETLLLIKAFPFIRFKSECIDGRELYTYGRDLESDRENPAKRHWHICGDIDSKKTGEGFILYYDFEHYQSRSSFGGQMKKVPPARIAEDILTEIVNDDNANTINIFSEKTQGYPYHVYVLGIAMLLETRFTPYAAVTGDITYQQAESAKKWADALLEKPVNIPVRVNRDLLYHRLSNYFQSTDLFSAFSRLCLGKQDGVGEFLLAKNPNIYKEWFLQKLKSYSNCNALGAIDLMIEWFNCTGNLSELCQMACLEENGPLYDPLEFAEAVCSTWLLMPPEKYEFMKVFSRPLEIPESVHSQFGNVMLDIGGFKGRKIKCYQSKSDVLAVFEKLFPKQFSNIEKIFDDEIRLVESNLEKLLERYRPISELINDESKEESEFLDDDDFLLYYDNNIKMTARQIKLLELMAYNGKRMLNTFKNHKESAELLNSNSMGLLIGAVSQLRLVLTEDAWDWIRKETNTDIIHLLVVFAALELDSKRFRSGLRALMENRVLCNKMLQLIQNQEIMTRVEAEFAAGTDSVNPV